MSLGYLPKPENGGRRRDHNRHHRAYWLERHEGDLACVICGARASERPTIAFDIDHGVALEDGGRRGVEDPAALLGLPPDQGGA
jgi:hypothetical protein